MTIIKATKCGFNSLHTGGFVWSTKTRRRRSSSPLYSTRDPASTILSSTWRLQTKVVGLLMQCSLAWFQLLTLLFSFLDQVHVSLAHLESKWFASVWSFLATMNASIQVDIPNIPPKQQEGDVYLMDMIIIAKTFSNADVRKLNYCRLYLQVVTLSDINKPNGEELDLSMVSGKPSLMTSQTKLVTVHQEQPSEQELTLWRRENCLWSDSNGHLLQSVTSWILLVQEQRQYHFACIHRRTLDIRELGTPTLRNELSDEHNIENHHDIHVQSTKFHHWHDQYQWTSPTETDGNCAALSIQLPYPSICLHTRQT